MEDIKRPKVAIGVYILNENHQLLISRRIGSHAAGTWCPQGGHLEFGESFFDCAAREAKEEVDIEVKKVEIIGITNDFHPGENKHYVTIHLKALEWFGNPRIMELDKMTDLGWFNLNNLPAPLLLSNQNFFDSNPLCLCNSGKHYFDCHKKSGLAQNVTAAGREV